MEGKRNLLFVVIAALQLWSTVSVENNIEENPRLILLNGRTIDTREEPQFEERLVSHRSITNQPTSTEPAAFLLHVSEVPEQRETLVEYLAQKYQTELLDYLPHNTYIIEGTPKMMEDLKKRDEVVWVGALSSENKISIEDTDDSPAELLVSFVRLSPKRSVAAIEAVANSIHDMLLASGELSSPDELVVTPVRSKTNRVGVKFGNKRDRDEAQLLISKISNVVRVEKRPAVQFLNQWARGIIEAGLSSAPDLNDPQSLVCFETLRSVPIDVVL